MRTGESLLEARARLDQATRDEAERLRRITQAAPPASSFEGQLQRWRDVRDDMEYEVTWSGGEGLTTMGERRAR